MPPDFSHRDSARWLFCQVCARPVACFASPDFHGPELICFSCTGYHPSITADAHPGKSLPDYIRQCGEKYPKLLPHYPAIAEKMRDPAYYTQPETHDDLPEVEL